MSYSLIHTNPALLSALDNDSNIAKWTVTQGHHVEAPTNTLTHTHHIYTQTASSDLSIYMKYVQLHSHNNNILTMEL